MAAKRPLLAHRTARLAACLALWLLFLPTFLSAPASPPASEEIGQHARYLASDPLLGRGVDTPGIDLARDYISGEFQKYGLSPGGEGQSYFQWLEVVTGVKVNQPATLQWGADPPLQLDEDWLPLGLSASGSVTAETVFAGYGITVPEHSYDDYAGIDAKGKVVLVLRYEPPPGSEKSPFGKPPRYSRHATFRSKAANARAHGAAGMILVDLSGKEELMPTRQTLGRTDAGILAVQVKARHAEKWLKNMGLSLTDLKARIDREEKPASISLDGRKVAIGLALEKIRTKTANIIAVKPGSDPLLARENIVVGAHYDHIGLGHFGTRGGSGENKIHYGADDNASGVAVLLALAEKIGREAPLPRTVIFVAFTGEELGLWGSRHYVDNPLSPIASTRAMLNFDMVGRMRENRLTVFGTATAGEFSGWLTETGAELGLKLTLTAGGIGRSDHGAFYAKDIPVLHFYTGSHEDYHRPTDTWDKLNVDGMAKVSDLALRMLRRTASQPLTFVRLPESRRTNSPFTSPDP